MSGLPPSPELWVCHLGSIEYRRALAAQEQLRERRLAGAIPDVLLILEHPAVYTRGRRSQDADLPLGRDWCAAHGLDVVDTDRGGRVTYHGPGQLVGYPIMRIGDVAAYVQAMERAIIGALGCESIEARVREGLTGVWVEDRKIASIGVHVSRGVTTHGFAVNVENDLEPFSWVVACGLAGVGMTSLSAERGQRIAVGCFRRHMAHQFCVTHQRRQRLVSPARLGLFDLAPAPASPAQASSSTPAQSEPAARALVLST